MARMITVDQAIAAILERARPMPGQLVPLDQALGLVLDEDIVADIDLPPFDKAMMDGYAIRSIDVADPGEHRLQVIEEVTAGQIPRHPLFEGQACRIMTGAPLPSGADAVVMFEKTRSIGDSVILDGPIRPGLSRLDRGREMKAGDVLLRRGVSIDATKLGLIASAGRPSIRVIPRPRVAVISTGDELVSPSERPEGGQIRDSNGVMLAGLARNRGGDVVPYPSVGDDPGQLRLAFAEALDVDILMVSGGVSAGTKDLVPSILIALGVEPIFHKVSVKPGKPIWFGVGAGRGNRPGPLVFGLPGNPASGVVGFLLFVAPAIDALMARVPRPRLMTGRLAVDFSHRGDRPTYHPSTIENGAIRPLEWAGSADLRTVALADGFVAFSAGDRDFKTGEELPFLPFDKS